MNWFKPTADPDPFWIYMSATSIALFESHFPFGALFFYVVFRRFKLVFSGFNLLVPRVVFRATGQSRRCRPLVRDKVFAGGAIVCTCFIGLRIWIVFQRPLILSFQIVSSFFLGDICFFSSGILSFRNFDFLAFSRWLSCAAFGRVQSGKSVCLVVSTSSFTRG